MTDIFERNRYLDSLMVARNQQDQGEFEEGLLGSPSQPTPSEIPESSRHPPPSPLTIRSKRVIDSLNRKDREGTPSKRREIMSNIMNPSLEELETVLSRNNKAQGLDLRLIIKGKRRRGRKP